MSKRRLEAWFDLVPRQGLVQIDDERQATEYAIRLVECAESETVVSKAELRALRAVAKAADDLLYVVGDADGPYLMGLHRAVERMKKGTKR